MPFRSLPVAAVAAGLLLGGLTPIAADAATAPTAVVAKKHAKKAKRKPAKAGKGKAKTKVKARGRRGAKAIDPQLDKGWAVRYRVRKAAGDADKDGLNNLGELQAGLNPRKPDTDGDGLLDGEENAGTIISFSSTGATIKRFGGGTVTASFGPDTALTCTMDDAADLGDDPIADAASHQLGDDDAADDPADDPGDDDGAGDDQGGDDDALPADDDLGDDPASCQGVAAGTRVYEAAVTGGVFDSFDVLGD